MHSYHAFNYVVEGALHPFAQHRVNVQISLPSTALNLRRAGKEFAPCLVGYAV